MHRAQHATSTLRRHRPLIARHLLLRWWLLLVGWRLLPHSGRLLLVRGRLLSGRWRLLAALAWITTATPSGIRAGAATHARIPSTGVSAAAAPSVAAAVTAAPLARVATLRALTASLTFLAGAPGLTGLTLPAGLSWVPWRPGHAHRAGRARRSRWSRRSTKAPGRQRCVNHGLHLSLGQTDCGNRHRVLLGLLGQPAGPVGPQLRRHIVVAGAQLQGVIGLDAGLGHRALDGADLAVRLAVPDPPDAADGQSRRDQERAQVRAPNPAPPARTDRCRLAVVRH
jgi:hypothetical protein